MLARLARRVAPVLVSGAAAALGAVVALEGAAAARDPGGFGARREPVRDPAA